MAVAAPAANTTPPSPTPIHSYQGTPPCPAHATATTHDQQRRTARHSSQTHARRAGSCPTSQTGTCAWPHSPQQPYHCTRSAPYSSSHCRKYGSDPGAPPTVTAAAGWAEPPLPAHRLLLVSLPAAADVESRRAQLRLPPVGIGGCTPPLPSGAPTAFAIGGSALPSRALSVAAGDMGASPLPPVASARRM